MGSEVLSALTTDRLRVEQEGEILTVTATSPATFNAQNRAMLLDLNRAFTEVERLRPLPRVLILTADGNQRFIGAAQPEYLMSADADEGAWASRIGQDNCRRLDRMPLVTIAAVNAAAIGGGLELAMACDFTYASTSATFAQAEARAGVVPGFGGTFRLPRRVGTQRARWMSYTGLPIDAQTALSWGLVLDVVPPERLMERVREAANQVLLAQPDAVRETKELLTGASELPLDTANMLECRAFASRMGRDELRVGMETMIRARDRSIPPP